MIKTVITYPNSILKKISKDVKIFDNKLHILLDNMYETMIANKGIGLAAIQIGVDQNVLIINLVDENEEQKKDDLLELINPKITHKDGSVTYQEGCLSVPGFYEDVERAEHVIVEYQDRFGNAQTLDTNGLLSIAIQHEMDHLRGKLFVDTFSFIRRKKFDKEYKKEQKNKRKRPL